MCEALNQLTPEPDFVLIDAMPLRYTEAELSLIKGDTKSISIAAASIIAKVTRDRLMQMYDEKYPGYDFANNMGYGTKTFTWFRYNWYMSYSSHEFFASERIKVTF